MVRFSASRELTFDYVNEILMEHSYTKIM